MSHSDDPSDMPASASVHLSINAGDSAVRIVITDRIFQPVADGMGTLETLLEPGLYAVEFQAGLLKRQIPITLRPDQGSFHVDAPDLPFSTPMPIAGTRTGYEYHARYAAECSRHVDRQLGAGSELFIFARGAEIQRHHSTAAWLTVRDRAGNVLVDVAAAGRPHGSPAPDVEVPWIGCTVELDPGAYRLRLRYSSQTGLEQANVHEQEQIIVVCKGWQTQVFIEWPEALLDSAPVGIDPAAIAIAMAPRGHGFDPSDLSLRHMELARLGLANYSRVIGDTELMDMLRDTVENPMLMLYSAHLLLLRPRPDHVLLRRIVDKLRQLIGEHPDLNALDIHLGERRADLPLFWSPPMIYQSWQFIINASTYAPSIVPTDSLAAQIADRIWKCGMWLTWQDLPPEPVSSDVAPDLAMLRDCVPSDIIAMPLLDAQMRLSELAQELRLSPLERSLFETVALMVRQQHGALHDLHHAELVRVLGVPSAAITIAAAGLLEKRLGKPSPRRFRLPPLPFIIAFENEADTPPLAYQLTTLVYNALITEVDQLQNTLQPAGNATPTNATTPPISDLIDAVETALSRAIASGYKRLEMAQLHFVDDLIAQVRAVYAPTVERGLTTFVERVSTFSSFWDYRTDLQCWHDIGQKLAQQFYAGSAFSAIQQRLHLRAAWMVKWEDEVPEAPFGYHHRNWFDTESIDAAITVLASSREHFANYLAYPFYFMYEYVSHIYALYQGSEFFTEGWLLYAANVFLKTEKQNRLAQSPLHELQVSAFESHIFAVLTAPCGINGYHKARRFRSWLEPQHPGYFHSIMQQLAAQDETEIQPATFLHRIYAAYQAQPEQLLGMLGESHANIHQLHTGLLKPRQR
jgi:hypothetical protein